MALENTNEGEKMSMIEMAHARAAELGLSILVRTLEDGEMLFALEYPEEAGGARLGLAMRVRSGLHTEEAATWLIGQMASAELQHEADRLAADEAPLVLEVPAEGPDDASEDRKDTGAEGAAKAAALETRILTALLDISILLGEMKDDEMTMSQVSSRIGDIATHLNGTAKTEAA